MRSWTPIAGMLALALALSPIAAHANDVDGPDDCQRTPPPIDFGDAPEDVLAYPGVIGHFPTCLANGAPGNRTFACPPISTAPVVTVGTGYVRHEHPAGNRIWLGCPQGVQPMGIDSEADAKVNDTGGPFSACNGGVTVDCTEIAGPLTFGQDERYGSDDACLAAPPTFKACGPGNVGWTIPAFSCSNVGHPAYLNILVDWNQDGDWNDNFLCQNGCTFEWAVKNFQVNLNPGCNTIFVPTFRVGPNPGRGWMRITLSDDPANDDFPWAGSATSPTFALHNGETEDYPVTILPSVGPCPTYEDWGDAPEEAMAYPGVIGRFPTCSAPGGPGGMEGVCPPLGPPPGPPVGYVRHVSTAADPSPFWLGCGNATSPGVDSEPDGKMNDTGGPFSSCSPNLAVDCTDFFGLVWGQDECYGDGVDAGLLSPTTVFFNSCTPTTIDYQTSNCGETVDAFLNILVDMNEDGDWNDNLICDSPGGPGCVYEWAVQNQLVVLGPGCETHTSPLLRIGPQSGHGWLRISITREPVPLDFPWNGSAGTTTGYFVGGETEDYPVMIRPANVGVGDGARGELMLAPISPNPAANRVAVRFTLPTSSVVSLAAFDVSGRKLADLAQGRMEPGTHQVDWNFRDRSGREVAAGYYVIRLRVGDRVLSQGGIRVR